MRLINGTRHRLPQRVYDIQEREAMAVHPNDSQIKSISSVSVGPAFAYHI